MRRAQRGLPASSIVLALAVVMGFCGTARAHSRRVDLALWGSFAPDVVRCQRAISHAAALCVQQVLNVRNPCMGDQLAGTACDSAAVDAAVQAARSRALNMVQQACNQTELSNLSFIDLSDATADVINICRQLDTAGVSAAFAPAMVAGSVSAVDASTQTCLDAAATGVSRLMRFSINARQNALDRIAATNLQPS